MQRLIAGLFLALVCASLYAQTMNLRATIPFAFRAGEQAMPAGEYTITHSGSGALTLHKQGWPSVILLTNRTSRPNLPAQGRLDFNRYGERYFLSSVWTRDSQDGREIPKSHAEKELARQTLRESFGIALQRQ